MTPSRFGLLRYVLLALALPAAGAADPIAYAVGYGTYPGSHLYT